MTHIPSVAPNVAQGGYVEIFVAIFCSQNFLWAIRKLVATFRVLIKLWPNWYVKSSIHLILLCSESQANLSINLLLVWFFLAYSFPILTVAFAFIEQVAIVRFLGQAKISEKGLVKISPVSCFAYPFHFIAAAHIARAMSHMLAIPAPWAKLMRLACLVHAFIDGRQWAVIKFRPCHVLQNYRVVPLVNAAHHKVVQASFLHNTFAHQVDIAILLNDRIWANLFDLVTLTLDISPMALNVQRVIKWKLLMHHADGVIRP